MQFARNSLLKTSISTRIAVLFSLTFTFSIFLAFSVSYFQISNYLEQTSKEVVASKFHEDAALLAATGVEGLREFLNADDNRAANISFLIQVLDNDGNTVFIKPSVQKQSFDFPSAFEKATDLKTILGWHTLPAFDDEDRFDMYAESVRGKYVLLVGKSSEDREALLSKLLDVFGATALVFAILSLGIGMFAARKILSPLRELLRTIREIEIGDLSRRVSVSTSAGELHDLGETFNRMIERIEKLVLVMRESLDNVAHDIRTPLTRIKIVAEDALVSKAPGQVTSALEDCAESATHISELVDQLLSISEADAGSLKLTLSPTPISNLVSSVAEIYEFVAQAKDIKLELETRPSELNWALDRKRVAQALGNLIDNAIKFSPDSSRVRIVAEEAENILCLKVIDEGPGVPPDDLAKIWDRLFRSDKSRSTPGLGLGLSIVRAITIAHGGTVDAQLNEARGTTFILRFPKG